MNFKKYHESKNLFDLSSYFGTSTGISDIVIGENSITFNASSQYLAIVYEFNLGIADIYTLSLGGDSFNTRLEVRYTKNGSNVGSPIVIQPNRNTVISGSDEYDGFRIYISNSNNIGTCTASNIMLNTGATPQPYEPYSSQVWHDIPHYIHKTDTDTITTLPAVIYANDNNATVGLKGNMSQTGTPTPTTPIQPQETGERTGNLLNPANIMYDTTYDFIAGNFVSSDTSDCSGFIPVTAGTYLRIVNDTSFGNYYFQFDANKTPIRYGAPGAGMPMVIPDGVAYVVFNVDKSTGIDNVMFARTSTVISYEPYGIKIPISSANTTTPVYLGEVETTRKIKKLVLMGDDGEWNKSNTRVGSFYLRLTDNLIVGWGLCDRAVNVRNLDAYSSSGKMFVEKSGSSSLINLWLFDTDMSLTDFKSYLAAQYAAGTPVTVWYVLATPTTGIVNEPLRKIGNYADEVSGISIPVTAGANTISVDTTLQPSEVTVNYKGWHPVQSVHEYDSNYTIATMQALTIAQLQTHTISDLQGGEWS